MKTIPKGKSNSNSRNQRIVHIDLRGYTHYEEFEVRGLFEETTKSYILQFCEEKHPVTLIHEKDNKYSDTAIKIEHDRFNIGYVPNELTHDIIPIINQKHLALISKISLKGTFIDIYVKVYFREQAN